MRPETGKAVRFKVPPMFIQEDHGTIVSVEGLASIRPSLLGYLAILTTRHVLYLVPEYAIVRVLP